MTKGSNGVPWSMTGMLMVVLIVVFALQCINDVHIQRPIERWLALTPECFTRGYVWQLLTFQFLHVDLWHIAGNLICLWFFGRFVENVLGRQRFLVAYFGCGVIGGLLQCLLLVLFPNHFFAGAVYGASAGIMGIFAIYALLLPESDVRLYFILPISAKVLLWAAGAVSLFFTIVPSPRGGGIAHAAHLGGLLAGIAWVKLGWHRDFVQLPWEGWFSGRKLFRERARKSELVHTSPLKIPRLSRSKAEDSADLPQEEFISREVDPILDKISQHGIQSLTERERKILEAARNKMAKR
ncbi:MAG TPA: rhomboid family intramembrane serine protease [Candidatus Angelobacter sp.]|nr:rhomboid family intramembrane serine protease [Candidatus Angelobacter sp.]